MTSALPLLPLPPSRPSISIHPSLAVASYASCSRGHGQICIRFLFARSDIANGGNVVPYAVPRTILSRISRYKRRFFVGSTPSPFRPLRILRAKFRIIFFFLLRFDPRDGYFLMESGKNELLRRGLVNLSG